MKKAKRVVPRIVGRDLNMHDGRPFDETGKASWGPGFFGYTRVTITAFVVQFDDGSQNEYPFNLTVHPDDRELIFRWKASHTMTGR